MKKVLLISNVDLKNGGGRSEKFATRKRMLQERDWDVVVGHVPEPHILLFPYAILKCLYIGMRRDVDVINSVSNPFHLQLIGYIVSQVLGLPWLVEFRDPMVENPDRDPDAFLTKIAAQVEKLAVQNSDQVVWGDGIQMADDHLETKYPDVSAEKFYKLPFLGFESEKFESAPTTSYDSLTITYAGSFYEGWIEPYELLEGFSIYVEQNNPNQDELTLQFYGDWTEQYQEKVEELGVSEFIQTYDFVPHDQIIPVLKGSDIVVYIGGDDPQNKLSVPSKIWDYMGAKTPILAIVDPSFRVAQLIEESDLGVVIHPDDTEAIAGAIEIMISKEFNYTSDKEIFDEFSRAHKMDVLAQTLDSISTNDNLY
ncbi:glycosyltransferase [Halonotius roseus]|uniref:Glycosyltransferase n=1 Tax=Halonotius roseus TaxID=2511997 RepID=A0A544QMX7_9EURY|nr:glycosyltransferase [Halonotius roseus]TQQ80277.1 glycosyltransferase [Halonotius roseus]